MENKADLIPDKCLYLDQESIGYYYEFSYKIITTIVFQGNCHYVSCAALYYIPAAADWRRPAWLDDLQMKMR